MGMIYHNGLPYGGGGSSTSAAEKELTYAEYLALSEEEKNNGTTYYITDVDNDDNINGYIAGTGIEISEDKVISVTNEISTIEIVIGSYLGKPLYRKVFNIDSLSSDGLGVRVTSDIQVVRYYGRFRISNNYNSLPHSYFSIEETDTQAGYNVSISNIISQVSGGNASLQDIELVLEYVKK